MTDDVAKALLREMRLIRICLVIVAAVLVVAWLAHLLNLRL